MFSGPLSVIVISSPEGGAVSASIGNSKNTIGVYKFATLVNGQRTIEGYTIKLQVSSLLCV